MISSPVLVFRTGGAWGPGIGVNLSASQVDSNFFNLAQAIVALTENPAQPDQISNIALTGGAAAPTITITMVSGATFVLPLPILQFNWRGAWVPDSLYMPLDTFTVAGVGIFSVVQEFTSGDTFDPNITVLVDSVPTAALQMLFGVVDAILEELADVVITDPAAGQVLMWNGAGLWVNAAPPLPPVMVGDTGALPAPAPAAGLVPAPAVGDAAAGMFLKADATFEVPPYPAVMVADTGAGGAAGLVPAPPAGSAAAGKYLSAAGTFEVPPGTAGGGGGVSFTNTGAWSGTAAYTAGDIAQFDGGNRLCIEAIGAPGTTITLDPAQVSPNVTLSNGNLTFAGATSFGGALGQVPTSDAGKLYFEFQVAYAGAADNTGCGLALAGTSLAGGGTAVLFEGTSGISPSGVFGGWSEGVWGAVAVDLGARLMWIASSAAAPVWNAGNSGTQNPATGAGGIAIPAGVTAGSVVVFAWAQAVGDGGTFNFGSGGFAGVPPTGFSAWPGTSGGTPNANPSLDATHWLNGGSASAPYTAPITGATIAAALNERQHIIDPAGTIAALTVTVPPTPQDGDSYEIRTSQAITALTVNAPGGATVNGAVFLMPANTRASWVYRAANTTWYGGN